MFIGIVKLNRLCLEVKDVVGIVEWWRRKGGENFVVKFLIFVMLLYFEKFFYKVFLEYIKVFM